MPEVILHRFKTHYFLSAGDRATQRRLDRLRQVVLNRAFDAAIDRAALPEEGELCIRNVSAPVRLHLDASEQSIAAYWSGALAQNLLDAIRKGYRSQAVYYYSRRQAIFDLVVNAIRGNFERAWAWRLMDLWPEGAPSNETEVVAHVVSVLRREPNLIVPALRFLAQLNYLPAFSRRFTSVQWHELSEAALFSVGLSRVPAATTSPASSRTFNCALRVLKRSQILSAIAVSETLWEADQVALRAIATLAVLDAEPPLLRQAESAAALTKIIIEAISVDRAHRLGSNRTAQVGESKGSLFATGKRPSKRSSAPNYEDENLTTLSADARAEVEDRSIATEGTDARAEVEDRSIATYDYTEVSSTTAPEAATEVLDPRRHRITQFGGLMFLLSVFEDLKLPEQILGDRALGLRPFVWTIHQLALLLQPIAPDDPAALALAGLSPDAIPPSEQQPPAQPHETRSLKSLAASIVNRLSTVLDYECETEEQLVDFVCRRKAEVVADPAWIEIRFSLDEVATEIRRAGLDLDPGYVTWLGVVVKFVYE